MRKLLFVFVFVLVPVAMAFGPVAAQQQPVSEPARALPNTPGSLKFAVLGSFGTGDRAQYQLAGQMALLHGRFKYDLVILAGGNIYGSERPRDFQKKFETPYKPLLDAGVTFHAVLGPGDSREQRYYKLFNMGGRLYYTFSPRPDVRFFALDAGSPGREQTAWLEQQLQASSEPWKIAFFHHSLYSSAERDAFEPLFARYNVSVVLTGHDFYERVKPQKGIAHFVVGSRGKRPAFLAAEIINDEMSFAAISRTGPVIDAGVVRRRD